MRWMVSEDRLGSDQIDVIEEIGRISTKPIWIQGYAGSGKSVLLLHSLKDYLVKKPDANVCVVVFTRALVDLLSTGLKQIPFLENKIIPVYTIYELKDQLDASIRYNAIFCDEIQDLPLSFISRMKSFSDHLIMAGDSAQSIYPTVPVFNSPPAKPADIAATIQPIEKKLKVIYRLTRSVIAMLKNVYPDMLAERPIVGDIDTEIKLFKSTTVDDEIRYSWADAKETNHLRATDVIAVLLYSHDAIVEFANTVLELESKPRWLPSKKFDKFEFNLLNDHLESNNVPLMYLANGYGSLVRAAQENKIVITTYHSAKGLDFDHVYLPLVGSGMWLHSSVPVNALLLVALSRSKSGLTITYTGELYNYLRPFLRTIPTKKLPEVNTNIDEVIF